MLTDLIAAIPTDAPAILSTLGYASVWPTLEARGVDAIKLSSLAFILRGQPLEDGPLLDHTRSFESLAIEDDGGPWIELVPQPLVIDLAQLPADRLDAVAAAWAATEEVAQAGWSETEARSFLGELSAFAATACAQDQRVLLRICL